MRGVDTLLRLGNFSFFNEDGEVGAEVDLRAKLSFEMASDSSKTMIPSLFALVLYSFVRFQSLSISDMKYRDPPMHNTLSGTKTWQRMIFEAFIGGSKI